MEVIEESGVDHVVLSPISNPARHLIDLLSDLVQPQPILLICFNMYFITVYKINDYICINERKVVMLQCFNSAIINIA